MRRRELLAGLAALAAVPLATAQGAQRTYRIGWLGATGGRVPPSFLDRMRQLGYAPGRTLIVEERLAGGDEARLPALARELVALKPDLLASGGWQGTAALKQATSSIPIVFRLGIDPVATGLVASLAHPGGNVTGVFQFTADLFGKRFELLRELAPRARRAGVLAQASEKKFAPMILDLANKTGFEAVFLIADNADEIRRAIGSAAARHSEGFIVGSGIVNNNNRQVIVDAIAATRLPAVYPETRFAEAGGLLAYAADLDAGLARLADYADRVLKGAKPADLPVEQARTVQLAVNLNTAKALGITIPQSILLRADRVVDDGLRR